MKKFFLGILVSFLVFSAVQALYIYDVDAEGRTFSSIEQTIQKGIFQLDKNKRFFPDREITRGELAEVLCRLKNIAADDCLIDLVKAGYMTAFRDGKFHLENKVTRGQAIAALIKLEGANYSKEKETGYNDVPASSWAVGAIATAIRDKLIPPGNGRSLNINKYITRASLAVLITRTKIYGSIPKTGWPEEEPVKAAAIPPAVQPKYQTETMLKAIGEMKSLRAEYKKGIKERQSLLKRKQILLGEIEDYKAEIATLNTNLTQGKAEAQILNKQLTTANAQLEHANKSLIAATRIRESLFARKQELSKENKDYKRKYPKVKVQVLTLNIQLRRAKAALTSTNAHLSRIQKLYDNSLENNKKMSSQNAGLNNQVRQLTASSNSQSKQRQEDLKTITNLKGQVNAATNSRKALAQSKQRLSEQLKELKIEKAALASSNIQLQAALSPTAKQQYQTDQQQYQKSLSAIKKLTVENTALKSKSADAQANQAKISELESELQKITLSNTTLLKRKQELLAENKTLKQSAAKPSEKEVQLEKQYQASLTKIAGLETQLNEANKSKLELKKAAAKPSAEQTQLQAKAVKLEKELGEAKKSQQALYQRKQELLAENKTLEQSAAKPSEKQAQLEKQYQASLKIITGLETQLAAADKSKAELFTRKQELVAENTKLKKTAVKPSAEQAQPQAKAVKLEKELAEAKKSQKALYQRKQELLDENRKLKVSLAKPVGKQTELQKLYKESLAKITKLETGLNKADQDKKALFKRKQELIAENAKLKQSISEPPAETPAAKKPPVTTAAEVKTGEEEAVTTAQTIAIADAKVSTPSEETPETTEFTAESIKVTFHPQPVLQEENLSITLKGIPAIVPVTRVEIVLLEKAVELIQQSDGSYTGQIAIPPELTGGKKKAVIRIFDNADMLIEKEVQYEVMQWWKG
ncbi:S-layer homology domain-containing protein [Candidatus Margulisiibacteriota bacterium]